LNNKIKVYFISVHSNLIFFKILKKQTETEFIGLGEYRML